MIEIDNKSKPSLGAILTNKEVFVLTKRYGLDGLIPLTLDQTGKLLGVTRERVRQIGNKALRKLKTNPRSSWLREYLE